MGKSARLSKVLAYQSLGFIAIILICWLDESMGLASLIFQNIPYVANFKETALKMLLILVVWLVVSASTRRLWDRIHYLESFLRVCSWCRRIDYKGKWMPLEDFMQENYDTQTTHGICHDCLDHQQAILKRTKEERKHQAKAA